MTGSGAKTANKSNAACTNLAVAVAAGIASLGVSSLGISRADAANSPIALAAGSFNYNTVVSAGTPGSSATISGGTPAAVDTENGITFWAPSYNASHALPSASTAFTSVTNSSTQFQFQPFTGNNALEINADNDYSSSSSPFFAPPYGQTGSLTLSKAASYTTLAVLYTASGQNYSGTIPNISYTLSFSDGSTYNNSGSASFAAYGWSNSTSEAAAAYRVWVNSTNGKAGQTSGGNFYLHEADISVPAADATKQLTGISFYDSGAGSYSNQSSWVDDPNSFLVYGLSGTLTPTQLTYQGSASGHAGSWDFTSQNFVNTANSPATISPYYDGSNVTFDDTATGPTAVTIAATVSPASVLFNNSSKNYSFTGAGIGGTGTVTLTGTGTVTFNNSNTYTGITNVSSGTLVIGAGGSVASPSVMVNSGAVLNLVSGGALTSPALNLSGSGTVGVNGSSSLTDTTGTFTGTLTGAGAVTISGATFQVGSQVNFNLSAGITIGSPAASASGTLLIADTVDNSAGIVNGKAVTATLYGSGLNGLGSLRGADGNTVTWAGNVAVVGGATISGGNGGTLTVAGPISGTGPVTFSSNSNATTVIAAVSTYTGGTILQNPATGTTSILRLGVDNALPAAGGLNMSGGAGGAQFDLNGHQQSLALISGTHSADVITNNGGSPSVLTITSGGGTYAGSITDGSGGVSLVMSGTGTQVLTGNSSYSGGTTISAGKLGAYSTTALGSGVVNLTGGVASLGGSAYTLNGNATRTANGFGLTDGNTAEGSSVFFNNPVTISDATGFSASFLYTATQVGGAFADGAAFVIQNDPRGPSALGTNGSGLGYGYSNAITPSVAILLNGYSPYGAQTNIGINGDVSGISSNGTAGYSTYNASNPAASVVLTSGDPILVSVAYNGITESLTETLTDTVTQGVYTQTYSSVDIPGVLAGSPGGSANGYIGFTGADGGVAGIQTVSSLTFNGGSSSSVTTYANNFVASGGKTSGIELTSLLGSPVVSIGSLTVNTGATLKLTSLANGNTSVGVLTTTGLTNSGLIDIGTTDLVVQNAGSTGLASITAMVAAGYNLTGGGKWQGSTGITSSAAAANSNHLTAVGVILNSSPSGQLYGSGQTFDGANPGYNDVLVKYTYFGDANLDGKVDGSDYSLIDAGYASQSTASPLSGWYNGDFNYDGKIDGSDYALIDNAFNNQTVSLSSSASVAASTAQVAGPTAVPEPVSLGLIALTAAGLPRRRR